MNSPAEEHAEFMQKCKDALVLKAVTTDGREFTNKDETESGIIIKEYYLFRAIKHQADMEMGKIPKFSKLPELIEFDGTSPYIKVPNSDPARKEGLLDFEVGPDKKLRPKTVKIKKQEKKSWWRSLLGL